MGRKGKRKMNWVEWIFAIVTLTFLGFLIVLPVYVVVHNILDRRRDREALRRRVHDAIEKITADGKVEGPEGPCLLRRRHGPLTDCSTAPPRHAGYYHHPWP